MQIELYFKREFMVFEESLLNALARHRSFKKLLRKEGEKLREDICRFCRKRNIPKPNIEIFGDSIVNFKGNVEYDISVIITYNNNTYKFNTHIM